jgi:hypothetical protein
MKTSKFALLVTTLAAGVALVGCGGKYDTTDNGQIRSGFVISVDAENGCQYLSRAGHAAGDGFAITPRMDIDKKQICGVDHVDYSASKKLAVMLDFGTGCEYVSADSFTRATPTPRLAPNGEQICTPKPKF